MHLKGGFQSQGDLFTSQIAIAYQQQLLQQQQQEHLKAKGWID